MKLSKYVNNRIGYEDFTSTDKRNLVETFVTHEMTLTAMFNAIFQNKTGPEISDKNKAISKQNSTELLGDFIKEQPLDENVSVDSYQASEYKTLFTNRSIQGGSELKRNIDQIKIMEEGDEDRKLMDNRVASMSRLDIDLSSIDEV